MFYECPKCKRRWEYPLAECPFCFVALNEMEGKAAKVINVVKVSIPTLFHPNVPYYILLLEDEFGNVWGYKSEKEYKAGDELKIEPNAENEAVAIWRVRYNFDEGIRKVIELIGGVNLNSNSKVVVLPTLTAPSHAYFRDNTSPEFLTAMLQILLDGGVQLQNMMIASQGFEEMPIAAIAQKSGLVDVCMKFKIIPLDLATASFEKIGQFEIAKAVVDADLVINLAAEKIGQASATNNLFRVLKKENYLGQKYLSSDAEIAAGLESILSKVINIGEAEWAQRSNKLTVFMGLVMAAKKARNLDRVFNEVAKSFKMPETIKDIAAEEIPVVGRSVKEVQFQAEIF